MRRLLVSSWILLLGPPVCRGQDFYSLSAENISGEEVRITLTLLSHCVTRHIASHCQSLSHCVTGGVLPVRGEGGAGGERG